jgi:3-methyladenine DNA glycosylase AlkD
MAKHSPTAKNPTAQTALARLHALADPVRAKGALRFFKAGPGDYGEGDRFLGVPVPATRALLRELELDLPACVALLQEPWHEARLLGLLGTVRLCKRAAPSAHSKVLSAYLGNTARINNWDLVDTSAEHIVGPLLSVPSVRTKVFRLARSKSLWERRIAMLAMFHPIKKGQADDALQMAERLLHDEHDLMHKAVGWMLREVGRRCELTLLRGFLERHAATMPRTALRYAIEHLSPSERAKWMRLR